MYAGKIVESSTTDDLFARMRHPYSDALLASVPKLDQDPSVRLLSIPGLPPDLAERMDHCRFAPRCRFSQGDCWEREPQLSSAADSSPGHLAACFHQVGVDRATVARQGELRRSVTGDEGGGARQAARAEGVQGSGVILQVRHLVKEFPVTSGILVKRRIGTVKAVSDVSFDLRRGETLGIVGESGSGKTTVGRMIVRLEKPDSGSIVFEGDELGRLRGAALRRRRRDLQLVFQDPYASLDPRMRVGTILREPLKVQGMGHAREQLQVVRSLLSEVGLSDRALDLYPHEFSGGQRQRIGLARALALDPKLLVADEPVSALDVSIQAQILNLLKDLQARHGLTMVVISHDLAVVKYVSDTIAVMYLGKLVEVGPALGVYANPAHHYTRALIDTIPVPDPALAQRGGKRLIQGELPSAITPPSGCRFRTRCPAAQERCAGEEPALRPFGPGHLAACHFPLRSATGGPPGELVPLSGAGASPPGRHAGRRR